MLGARYVEFIHDELIAQLWPGADPISVGHRDRRLIESAAARPFHSAFGQDAYPTLVEKAAVLFHSLIANHPFHDGNKRTAVLAFEIFLVANGHVCLLTTMPTYQLAERTASYRERGRSHDEALREIVATIEGQVILLSELRDGNANSFRILTQMRTRVRRSRLNKLIASG
jgi:death-on-curing protein